MTEKFPHILKSGKLDSGRLRELCLANGADAAGFVEIERPGLSDQLEDILKLFPDARSIVCLTHRVNPETLRVSVDYIKDTEFNYVARKAIETSRKILWLLDEQGVRGVPETGTFPMEGAEWPGKMWRVAQKPLAVEAGLGQMGINRLVLHPRFGAFMIISSLLIDVEITDYDRPVERNPCLECSLCVATCPTGAVSRKDEFSFVSCLTHNYREKLGGFSDWVKNIAVSRNLKDYRQRVSDQETISMWQSLSYGAGTKCDYCMAVCPAGSGQETGYKENRKEYTRKVSRPLRKKEEDIYVVAGSDAEAHVNRKPSNKTARRVSNALRPGSIKDFVEALPLVFQKKPAKGLNAVFHFYFSGDEEVKAAVTIKDQNIQVLEDVKGKADISIYADSSTWLRFLAKEQNLALALLTRKIRIKGPPKLMSAFGCCFP